MSANHIEYEFEADAKRHRLVVHLVVCDETWADLKTGETRHSRWAWISRQPLTQDNVIARCNRADRNRGKIESNLLVLKQYDDHYEDAYSYDWTAMLKMALLYETGPFAQRADVMDPPRQARISSAGTYNTD